MALIHCPECGLSVSSKGEACPRCAYPIHKLTNLFDASRKRDEEMISDLLKSGADPNITDNDSATPLMLASYNGDEKIVKALLVAGANPNLKRGRGTTALMDAAYQGHTLVVRALLEAGADPAIMSDSGTTAADLAKKKKRLEIKALLEQNQIQREFRHWQGEPERAARRIEAQVHEAEAQEQEMEEAQQVELAVEAEAPQEIEVQEDALNEKNEQQEILNEIEEVPPTPEPESVEQKLFCLKCEESIGAEDLVCPHCKVPILRKYCNHCSKLIPDHAEHCPYCKSVDTGRFHYMRHIEGIVTGLVAILTVTGLLAMNRWNHPVPQTAAHNATKPAAIERPVTPFHPVELSPAKLQTPAFPKEQVNPMRTMTKMQQPVTRIATPKKLAAPKAATPELTPVAPSSFAQARRLNDQGYLLMKQGRYDEAVAVLHRAIRTFPPGTKNIAYAYALYNLGRSLRLSGHPDVAIPILQERLKYENQREVVARELQAAKREAGEPDSALRFD